jgi:hypothetical protein
MLLIVAICLLPRVASAQICPISNHTALPVQPGHPWTHLTSCVNNENAIVGGKVNDADCTDAYVGKGTASALKPLGTITVQSGGTLVLLDHSYSIRVGSIIVQNGGTLQIGAQACPIEGSSEVSIIFTGAEGVSKGIDVKSGGTLRMWGARGNTTLGKVSWAHLSQPAGPTSFSQASGVASPVPADGANTLSIDKALPDWQMGDWVVVAGTDFAPDSGEVVQIHAISVNVAAGTTTITTAEPLVSYHFGGPSPTCIASDPYCGPSSASFKDGADKNYGVDERAEVGLLTRNIRLTSVTPNPYKNDLKTLVSPQPAGLHWGGALKLEAGFQAAEIAGVELEKFGGDQDVQFPIYVAGKGSAAPVLSSNSIHHSYNKCIALAGLTGATINDNVCTRIVGDMFYLRTGAEQSLTFTHNLGVGAMSNGFTLNPAVKAPAYAAWWPGDNLTNHPTEACGTSPSERFNCYDGFNVPLTDSTSLPVYQNAGFASSGFWITNPNNNLNANSIAGCQAQGIGFSYNLISYLNPSNPGTAFLPLGSFVNNRAHGCYYGLTTPSLNGAAPTSRTANFEPLDSVTPLGHDVVAHFDGVTVTRNRYIGIWARPHWYDFTNARLATNREGASLVSSGGIEGSSPGVWSLMDGATYVGESMNNPWRFGPCPYYTGPAAPSGVPSAVCPEIPPSIANGYPDAKWNEFGYMFYDGPARIENSRFVNYEVDPSSQLTSYDATYLKTYAAKSPMPCDSSKSFVYEGDAALGWFQANQQLYPPTQYTENVTFENVDMRHQVYTQEVGVTCSPSGSGNDFQDGDKNTVILDHDDTLTGYQVVDATGTAIPGKFPISLNNLPFLGVADTTNGVLNTVDECHAEGGQDTVYENRPTSLISPNDYATLELSAVPCALSSGKFSTCTNSNLLTFTKDQLDYGSHQSMTLNGRNKNGIYEPKVMNGLGYTVQAQKEMPPFVSMAFTDASVTTTAPFATRIGVCYTTPSGPLTCPGGNCSSVFTV